MKNINKEDILEELRSKIDAKELVSFNAMMCSLVIGLRRMLFMLLRFCLISSLHENPKR